MKIETYEIEPQSTDIATLAADGEAREICEKLGLEGQLSLSNNESQTVFPYRVMTKLEQLVFELHCPNHTKLRDYKSEAIPVRVLQVAAHATDCKFLHHIRVWHPEDSRLDPVLVGYTSEYGGTLYLLARWGAVWKDFSILVKEAKAIWKQRRLAAIKRAEQDISMVKACLDTDADSLFSTGSSSSIKNSIYLTE